MTQGPFELVGLGECMVELYAQRPLSQADALTRAWGGDVLNALVGAARLGARTGFITRVGDDPFGVGLRQAWQAEGVDTFAAPLVSGDNGVYFISLTEDGEREFTYRRRGSAASTIDAGHLDEGYIAGARCLLLSGITQAISESAQRATLRAAYLAKKHGVMVAYDPNYRPRLWAERGGVSVARQAFAELLPWVDWLLPSFPADGILLSDRDEDPREMALRFAQLVPNVAQKRGEDGCDLVCDGDIHQVPTTAVARVVDSTGAGDAWNGAFLYHLLQGAEPDAAAQAAHQAAAYKLAHRGAIPPIHPTKRSES
jgi:2-dehydro-3-deoxygluconokinase